VPYHAISDPSQLQALLDAVLSVEAGLDLPGVLQRVVEAARTLTGARYGALGVLDPNGKGLAEFVHVGMDDAAVARIGHLPEGNGVLGVLILDPEPLRLADLTAHPDAVGFPPGHPPMRSFLGVPLRLRQEVYGNLYLTEKQGGGEFTEGDQALVVALAEAAGIAIENARLHARLDELRMTEDRQRIARDLHDTVVQRIFATGLALQAALPLAHDPELRARIAEAVSDLDETIRQVRTTIFVLEPPPGAGRGVRAQVLEICTEAARSLGFDPEVRFSGPLERFVGGALAVEMLSTLREALSNVARHARAAHTHVDLSVLAGELHLRVVDDGIGLHDGRPSHGKGLPNMAQRAESLGGSFTLAARPHGGTELHWHVPLEG